MIKRLFIITIFLIVYLSIFSQNLGFSFQEAEKHGISIKNLDDIYQNAVHTDTSLAVFRTADEQIIMQQEYIKLLQDFGKFLSENNFTWDKPTRCFNKIYFDSDGTIDYFLFNFLGEENEKPSKEKQKEFERLLNLFIKDYKFALTAKTKFSQCSPTTYRPKSNN